MIDLLSKKYTFRVLKVIGLFFLVGYFLYYRDFRFSIVWALAYVLLGFGVSILLVGSKIYERFPVLEEYHFYRNDIDKIITEAEFDVQKVGNLEVMLNNKDLFLTPFEDAFICVPILILGINPLTALLGGMFFGFMHLARFNYYECLGKAIYYTLAIYFMLPYGLLTIVIGHFMADFIVLILLKLTKTHLKSQSQ